MSLRLGDTAPDFEVRCAAPKSALTLLDTHSPQADTSKGPIRFHDYINGSWAILFSHPDDYRTYQPNLSLIVRMGEHIRAKKEQSPSKDDGELIGDVMEDIVPHATLPFVSPNAWGAMQEAMRLCMVYV